MSGDQTNIASTPSAELRQGPRRENLALVYQEILTVITRLRVNRQAVMDAGAFRSSMKAALAAAEADATRKGYTPEDARLATFAVVAFLDESVENANDPNFADWSRRPLQEELFGEPASGEIFFQCIDRLLARSDSPEDADVLEVFALCLSAGVPGTIRHERTRGRASGRNHDRGEGATHSGTAPIWLPTGRLRRMPCCNRLMIPGCGRSSSARLGALFLAVLFFVGFKIALLSGASGLHSISLLAPH